MDTLVVGHPAGAVIEATTSTDERSSSTSPEPPAKSSVLQKFLTVRGLTASDKPHRRVVKVLNPTKLTAEALSKSYTKRRHGDRVIAQRAALGEPDDVYCDSVDAYVPRKRQQELVNLHKDEHEVNDVFLTETRALSFQREVLDKVVCDREENSNEYEEKLWRLMVQDRGLQGMEDVRDNHEINGETNDKHCQDQEREIVDEGPAENTLSIS